MNTLPSIPGIVLNLMAKPCQGVGLPRTVAVAELIENHRQRIDGQETVHLRLAVRRAVSGIHGGSGPQPENPGREDKTRRRLGKRGLTGRGGVGRKGGGCMRNGLTGESGHPKERPGRYPGRLQRVHDVVAMIAHTNSKAICYALKKTPSFSYIVGD
jgi:hypothetical protein